MTINNAINNIDKLTVNIQKLSFSGTYTPSAGTVAIIVEMVGGGGGAGSAVDATGALTASIGSSGSSGGYLRFIMTAAQIGSSLSYSVGSGGGISAPGGNAGNNGTASTFGGWTAGAGRGGVAGVTSTASGTIGPSRSAVNILGTGTVIVNMQPTTNYTAWFVSGSTMVINISAGGSNPLSVNSYGQTSLISLANSGNLSMPSNSGVGGGGNGNATIGTSVALTGESGAMGTIIVTEFIQN